MIKKISKIWLIAILIISFLIIGNPGKRQFKEFLGTKSDIDIRRKYNFLVFSIWIEEQNGCDDVYFATAFNFFKSGFDCN